MQRPVTIRDVARRAEVSIATVSRVLNAPGKVREHKRKRVEEAIQALGFRPNQMARGLLNKETGGLGIILPYVGGEFFSEFLTCIDKAAQESGFFLMISTSHRNTEAMELVLHNMRSRVDGIMIMASDGKPKMLQSLVGGPGPVIFVNSNAAGLGLETINFDNFMGAFLATEHLIELGHKRIAMLKGPEASFDATERLRGYREALRKHNLKHNPCWELPGDFTPEAGNIAAHKLVTLEPRPTAVFGANDQSTIVLMSVLRSLGLQIPQQMSIVGFDDIPAARYATPPLTSVRVPVGDIGKLAISRLIQAVRKKAGEPETHVLPVELIIRASTTQCN
ncbi:MAG: LacI family DNA-binding transcriptional regulator [Bacteroidota bacterium]